MKEPPVFANCQTHGVVAVEDTAYVWPWQKDKKDEAYCRICYNNFCKTQEQISEKEFKKLWKKKTIFTK